MKIDSHQHYWEYSAEEYAWITDDLKEIKQSFLAADSKKEMDKLGFDYAVAVQARQNLVENDFLLKLSEDNDHIAGVVGWLDLKSSALDEQLAQYASHPNFVGVRHIVQDEPDINFLIQPDFVAGVKKLQEHNLAYDILIFEKHLEVAEKFVQQLPDHRLVIDHIAKPAGIGKGEIDNWAKGMKALAKYEHVSCKLSGLPTEADWKTWKNSDFSPYLEVVLEAFGPERLMIGSDWPVCKLAASYEQAMNIVLEFISKLSQEEQNLITGKNALDFYKLPISNS